MRAIQRTGDRRALAVLGVAAVTTVAAFLMRTSSGAHLLVSDALLAGCGLLSGLIILSRSRLPDAWEGTVFFGTAMLVMALAKAIDFGQDLRGATTGGATTDLFFLLVGALFLFPARIQFRDHFLPPDRREISADVALIAAAMISVVYLLIRPLGPDEAFAAFVVATLFAATAAAAITAFVALSLWVPTPSHLGQLAVVGVFAGATLAIGSTWVRGESPWGNAWLDLPLALATLGIAALMIVRSDDKPHQVTSAGWGRPLLTTIAVASAAGSLGIVAALMVRGTASLREGAILIGLLGAAIAARILVNQVRSTQEAEATRLALAEKEEALAETDHAMEQLRDALRTLADSEERLRLLFDAAVDGIVELDGNDIVRQANGAFCEMVGLEREFVVGKPWDRVAAAAPGGASIASLLVNGQATLQRQGHEIFLEARASQLPGAPPGRLLLVRDVTATRVADQTIRSLFKFLQDRDEDRTRLSKRTNAAIEAERNRIARDLHDGPVQGVSAASLSLEAVLLMLNAGDVERAQETLVKVRSQLSEEADNLRRVMGNLRPPLLEERGLVPALQETVTRFGHESGMKTRFRSRSLVEVPADLETLAYRLVQEALTNARKHSKAEEVTVTVDAVAGQLKIEISDNGVGFDPNQARDFLRAGKVGLASMRERIELAGGTFVVRSGIGNGTTVVATLPLDSVPTSRELATS